MGCAAEGSWGPGEKGDAGDRAGRLAGPSQWYITISLGPVIESISNRMESELNGIGIDGWN